MRTPRPACTLLSARQDQRGGSPTSGLSRRVHFGQAIDGAGEVAIASAGLFGSLLLTSTAPSAVPLPLLRATIDVAMSTAAGSLAAGTASSHVSALAQSVFGGAQRRISNAVIGMLLALATALVMTILAVWSVAEATIPPQALIISPAGSESLDGTSGADGISTSSHPMMPEKEANNSAAGSTSRCCGS